LLPVRFLRPLPPPLPPPPLRADARTSAASAPRSSSASTSSAEKEKRGWGLRGARGWVLIEFFVVNVSD
jgi:hypothetical protein